MKKEKLDTTTTQDLFKVKDCPACDGKGTYLEKDKDIPGIAYIEDCDICEGSGSIWQRIR